VALITLAGYLEPIASQYYKEERKLTLELPNPIQPGRQRIAGGGQPIKVEFCIKDRSP